MANEAVVAVPGVLRQTLILTQKNLLVKARSWKTSLSELLFPVLLLLMFNAPNIFVDRPSAAPTEVVHYGPIPAVLANTTTALEAAIGEVVSVLAPPLFPPTPPYDALRPPLFWDKSSSGPHGGVPILGIAPTSSARASLLYATLHLVFNATGFRPNVQLFATEAALEAAYLSRRSTLWAGVIVHDVLNGTSGYSYTLRLNGTYVPSSVAGALQMVQPIGVRVGALHGDFAYYASTGFTALQNLVDACLALESSEPRPQVRQTREMPSVPNTNVNTPYALVWITGWCMNIANTFFVSSALAAVVFEKEHRIWQGLATLGVSPAAWWAHWIATLLGTAVPVAALDTAVMYIVGNCYFSNPILIFIFVLLYFIALMAVVIALVPFLPKSDKAVTLSTGVAFILSILYLPLVVYGVDDHLKRWLGFIPWHAFFYGVEIMRFQEDLKVGITFQNFAGNSGEFGVSFAFLLLIMSIAPFLWLLFAVYASRVAPAFGAPRGVCFCATEPISALLGCTRRTVMKGAARSRRGESPRGSIVVDSLNAALLEASSSGGGSSILPSSATGDVLEYDGVDHEVPNVARVGVRVRSLVKTYRSRGITCKRSDVRAVRGLSFDLMRGEIFSLLGHNGAGKTTTIQMLSGIETPTAGAISFVDGAASPLSFPEDAQKIRSMMGVCGQHDSLYPNLSAREHLMLHARLRGYSREEARAAADVTLERVGLDEAQHRATMNLSGGMQRKVSLAIALIGSPSILLLDEPTAGMDPKSRRSIWDMIQKIKAEQEMVIVLTTHFMDEADVLGDRIGIMHSGQLKCSGSSLFLKLHFGIGYRLKLTFAGAAGDRVSSVDEESPRESESVAELVRRFAPRAVQVSESGPNSSRSSVSVRKEVTFSLPMDEAPNFGSLLAALESQTTRTRLGIQEHEMGLTTLEEVFLRLTSIAETEVEDGAEKHEKAATGRSASTARRMDNFSSEVDSRSPARSPTARPTFCRVMKALLRVRALSQLRDVRSFFFKTGLPLVWTVLAFVITALVGTDRTHTSTAMALNVGSVLPASALPLVIGLVGVKCDESFTLPPGVSFVTFNDELDLETDWSRRRADSSLPRALGAFISREGRTETPFADEVAYNASYTPALPLLNNLFANCHRTASEGAIHVASHPLPNPTSTVVNFAQLLCPMFLGMAFMQIALGAVPVAQWKLRKIQHLLYLMGVSPLAYWATNMLYDVLQALPIAIVATICAGAFPSTRGPLLGGASWFGWILVVVSYPLAVVPFSYLAAFPFKDERTLTAAFPLLIAAFSLIPYIVVWVMGTNEHADTRAWGERLGDIFSIVPTYTIQRGIGTLLAIAESKPEGEFTTFADLLNPSNHFVYVVAANFVMAPLCILGLYLVERARSMKRLGCDARRKSASATPLAGDGADGSGDGINAIQLRKTFVSSNGGGCGKKSENNVHVAVDDLSFSVAPGEVFCLLGPNGAGKTTTMRMLTRMMVPDRGSVVLGGCDLDVPRELREVYSFTGFCPQFDALWPLLTTREHLEVYATLKDAAAERAGELMSTLALSHAEKRYSKNLSGGMRRKLSVAISLLGAPRVVFMDEPSTGMDPASKRLLWKLLLRETAASHSAVLLSTHSMEESEALASRIGIMVKGSMRAIDTTAGLKHRFGEGSIVELTALEPERMPQILNALLLRFPTAVVVENVGGRAVLDVPLTESPLSGVFSHLEEKKEELGISFYSVAQASLEQIFLRFANEQVVIGTE